MTSDTETPGPAPVPSPRQRSVRRDRVLVAVAAAVVTTAVVLTAVVVIGHHGKAKPPSRAAPTTTAASGTLPPPSTAPGQTAAGRPFAATSFWNAPLPASTPLNPLSSVYVTDLERQIAGYFGGTAGINTTKFSAPIYVVGHDQPTIPIHYWNCQNKSGTQPQALFEAEVSAVPMPPNATVPTDHDAEMVVWQPSTAQEWEIWRARRDATGGWQACWGGHLSGASYDTGIFPHPYGATATGLPLLGGEITMAELRSGHIDHALGIAIPDARKAVFSWPANRTDGQIADPNAIPEGERFRLDPTLDIAALHLNPVAQMIAEAAQRYGIVVWDRAGAVVFRAENPLVSPAASPANPYHALFNQLQPAKVLADFPFNRLEALPFNYGQTGS